MSDHLHGHIVLLGSPERVGSTLPLRLRELGHRVSMSTDVRDALTRVFDADVDLLLIDPGNDPDAVEFELCARLAERDLTEALPVAFLIGRDARLLPLRAWRAGAGDILDPQLRSDELDARIQRLLRQGRRERRLLADRRRLLDLLDEVGTALMIVDEDGRVSRANRSAMSMLGLDPDVLRVNGITRILSSLGVPLEIVERVLMADGPVSEEVTANVGGVERALAVRCLRLPVAGDGRPAVAVLVEDVTDRRDRDRLQADFHSMIAHDLRNPISVIQGYLQLLGDPDPGISVAEVVDRIAHKVEDVSRLLDDFLDFSMLEAGFLRLEPSTLSVAELVGEAARDVEILARRTGAVLHVYVDPSVDELSVTGDAQRLRQVLQNLMTNAVKYGGTEAPISVRAQAIGRDLRISVSDRGPGIPHDEQALVFERYQRARRDRDDGRGIGLGLVIVRRIVEAHGGRVGLSSEPGVGSTFWFDLPGEPTSALSETTVRR